MHAVVSAFCVSTNQVGIDRVLRSRSPMPMSVRRQCPQCTVGIGIARSATVLPDRPTVVVVTLACQSCGHEWKVKHELPPVDPTSNPPEKLES